jgi:Cu2+-exporting ATPase
MLCLAAAVESGSLHPIGRAVCEYVRTENLRFVPGDNLTAFAGGGVSGVAGQTTVVVGSARYLAKMEVSGLPDADTVALNPGDTAVLIAGSGRYLGIMVLRDKLRDDALHLVDYFKKLKIKSILLSGDREETALFVSHQVGMAGGFGEMSPADKTCFIDKLQAAGERVLMVGDGINDAAALAVADVGCAVAGGTDIALETSDIVLTKPGLAKIAVAHRLARKTVTIVRQNLGWAFIYNIIGIPLAMTGHLTPIYAAAAMALSSLCVVGNSLRITRIKHG